MSKFSALEIRVLCGCTDEWQSVTTPDALYADEPTRRAEYDRLAKRGIERGYKPGWAAYRYHDVFGRWPPRAWAPVRGSAE